VLHLTAVLALLSIPLPGPFARPRDELSSRRRQYLSRTHGVLDERTKHVCVIDSGVCRDRPLRVRVLQLRRSKPLQLYKLKPLSDCASKLPCQPPASRCVTTTQLVMLMVLEEANIYAIHMHSRIFSIGSMSQHTSQHSWVRSSQTLRAYNTSVCIDHDCRGPCRPFREKRELVLTLPPWGIRGESTCRRHRYPPHLTSA
jgi:hypothetical protein